MAGRYARRGSRPLLSRATERLAAGLSAGGARARRTADFDPRAQTPAVSLGGRVVSGLAQAWRATARRAHVAFPQGAGVSTSRRLPGPAAHAGRATVEPARRVDARAPAIELALAGLGRTRPSARGPVGANHTAPGLAEADEVLSGAGDDCDRAVALWHARAGRGVRGAASRVRAHAQVLVRESPWVRLRAPARLDRKS